MAKAPGLYRPDGRPVRQFGEDIIEPGEAFSGDTLSTIRTLVSDDAPTQPTTSPPDDTAKAVDEPPAPERAPPTVAPKDLPTALQEVNPERDLSASRSCSSVPEDFGQVLADLDDYAQDRLHDMQVVQQAAAQSFARHPSQDHANLVIDPPKPSARDNWRRLVIVEGAPGRSLRRFVSRPRMLALLLLVIVSFWRPWFIPLLSIILFTSAAILLVMVGAERVGSAVGWWFQRLQKRNPARASRLLHRGNRFLKRAEWLADRLPPAWVQGFHVPDLDAAVAPVPDDAHLQSRFERIAAQERSGPGLAKGT